MRLFNDAVQQKFIGYWNIVEKHFFSAYIVFNLSIQTLWYVQNVVRTGQRKCRSSIRICLPQTYISSNLHRSLSLSQYKDFYLRILVLVSLSCDCLKRSFASSQHSSGKSCESRLLSIVYSIQPRHNLKMLSKSILCTVFE